VIGAAQIAAAAMEDVSGQVVAAFLQVAHALDLRPIWRLIDIRQHMQGLEDPPLVGQRCRLPRSMALIRHAIWH